MNINETSIEDQEEMYEYFLVVFACKAYGCNSEDLIWDACANAYILKQEII